MPDEEENAASEAEQQSRPNATERPPRPTPHYFIPRRPRVVKMRDLSPATRALLTREYYDAYDPWTGIRIAATLGILISLFTLFLIYKSRFHRSKNTLLPAKKTSLYLYDEEGGTGDSGRSPSDSGSFGYSFACNRPQPPFRLEEVFVKGSMVERVALKVLPPTGRGGPKYGTLRITEETPIPMSLPCSPYRPQLETEVKAPPSVLSESLTDSIASFGSSLDSRESGPKVTCRDRDEATRKNSAPMDEELRPKSLVVTAKKPQDYRSRSTVVAIARRKRPS